MQRILLGIDSTGVPIFAREAKAIACFTAEIRHPTSEDRGASETDAMSHPKKRMPKQIPF